MLELPHEMRGVRYVFFKILKKDMKRKKVMNIILLLFLILASALIGSSLSVFYSTVSAIDYTMDKSNVADLIQLNSDFNEGEEFINNINQLENPLFDEVIEEPYIVVYDSDITTNKKERTLDQSGIWLSNWLQKIPTRYNKVFDERDRPLVLKQGEIAIPRTAHDRRDINIGDNIQISLNGQKYDFVVAHIVKDVAFGSDMLSVKRYFISDEDYEGIDGKTENANRGYLSSLIAKEGYSDNDLLQQITNMDLVATQGFNFTKSLVSLEYIFNMLIAGIMVMVSIILIAIAFMILRFTIMFTLQEEYKEIGIMKAIGIKNRAIRKIYLVKYFFLALLGGSIGLVLSVPLSSLMSTTIEGYLILGDGRLRLLLSTLGVILVIFLTIIFCYRCTGKIRKFSAMDAIRQGSTGERFKGIKRFPSLRKTKMRIPIFLGVSDIFADIRKFLVLTITFILGTVIMIIPINATNTLKSDNMMEMLGLARMDSCIKLSDYDESDVEGFIEDMKNQINEVVPNTDFWADYSINVKLANVSDTKSKRVTGYRSVGKKASEYNYLEGVAPDLENEISITRRLATYLNVGIGDTVIVSIDGKEHEFIVSALYQTVMNMGDGFRLSEKMSMNMPISKAFLWACKFNASNDNISNNIEKLKEAFPAIEFQTTQKFLSSMLGSILDSIDDMILICIVIIGGVVFLITCLLVKMLLTKEIPEVALLKSLGFRNSSIKTWQISRILIVLLASVILGTIIANTGGNYLIGLVFKMMGADKVMMETKVLQVYVVVPLFLLVITTIAALCSIGQIKKTKIWEINNQD